MQTKFEKARLNHVPKRYTLSHPLAVFRSGSLVPRTKLSTTFSVFTREKLEQILKCFKP